MRFCYLLPLKTGERSHIIVKDNLNFQKTHYAENFLNPSNLTLQPLNQLSVVLEQKYRVADLNLKSEK